MGELSHLPGRAESFAEPSNLLRDEVATQPAGDEVHVAASGAGAGGQRSRKPFDRVIQALADRLEDRLRLGPAADGKVEPLARSIGPARQAMLRTMCQFAQRGKE